MTSQLFSVVIHNFDFQSNYKNIVNTVCAFDIRLYLTPLGQARQFIETCGI